MTDVSHKYNHASLMSRVWSFVAAVFFLVWLSGNSAVAQLSPGDLAEPHQGLEGLANCTQCHELGEGPSDDKCLTCHTALSSSIKTGTGYHHLMMGEAGATCVNCHRDHAGKDFELINWLEGYERFDHSLAGYILHGKHATTACRECHNPVSIISEKVRNAESTDITKTYLGLGRDCLSCHLDEHRKQLIADCTKCHLDTGFKGAEKFEHSQARFILTGKHVGVECAKCHKAVIDYTTSPRDTSYVQYTNLPYDLCIRCHQDQHKGKYKEACDQCHTTKGWKMIIAGRFDHSKTSFPLIGKHLTVKCETCHKSPSMLEPVRHEQCRDCHTDIHMAQFAAREDQGQCESCHNQNGFMPPIFTIEDHQKTGFGLRGAHLAEACILCHPVDSATWAKPTRLFKMKRDECTDCHRDIHAGQFTTSEPLKRCIDCHNERQWTIVEFDHKLSTNYPLVGAHKKIRCAACHKQTSGELVYTLYRHVGRECADCHANPERLSELEGKDS